MNLLDFGLLLDGDLNAGFRDGLMYIHKFLLELLELLKYARFD